MVAWPEPARPAAVREHRLAPWFAVVTVCFGAFMGQLDASAVTVALPAMQRHFGTGLAGAQWVSLAYLLVLVSLLIPVGCWSDRYGRKLTYLAGLAVFVAASAGCGLAGSLAWLVALRAVQGCGAAMLQANSVALVTTSAPARDRRRALGLQAAAQALGLAIGPVAGGALIAIGGWQLIFFVNVPVGLAAAIAGWYLLPRTRDRTRTARSDPVGAILLATAAAATLIVVSWASGLAAPAAVAAGCAVLAPIAWVVLTRWERRAATPLADPRRLAASGAGPALLGALCAYLVLFGPLVLIPQLASAAGGGPLRAGLLLTALAAGFGLAALAGEHGVLARWPNRRRCVIGGLVASAAVAALAIPAAPVVTAVLLGLLGAGLGAYVPANNAGIMAAAPAGDAAVTGGMVNVSRGLGTALGVTMVTLSLHAGADAGLSEASAARLAFTGLAAVAIAATLAATRRAAGPRSRSAVQGRPGAAAGVTR